MPNRLERLKKENLSIHVVTSGAGVEVLQMLWAVPGASKYFSGGSFPYHEDETTELLGFKRQKAVCADTAIDFASAAYMKAYRWGGPSPVGVGITCAVRTDRVRRGDDLAEVCIITDNTVDLMKIEFPKLPELGDYEYRYRQEVEISEKVIKFLDDCLDNTYSFNQRNYEDNAEYALERFFVHPYFDKTGVREYVTGSGRPYAMFPGSFNPLHEGHIGIMHELDKVHNHDTIFTISADNPKGHKKSLTVQDLLKRAKLLKGYNVLFERHCPLYIDKARTHNETPLVLGADSLERMLDPRWKHEREELMCEFASLGTTFFFCPRNGVNLDDVFEKTGLDLKFRYMFTELNVDFNISSSELRKQK